MNNLKHTTLLLIFLTSFFFISCNKNDENTPPAEDINLRDATLNGFSLLGITPISSTFEDPKFENNKETAYGEVHLVVPSNTSIDKIKTFITSNELNLNKFTILPGNNKELSYESESHIHSIVNINNKDQELLHYRVTIEKEPETPTTTLNLLDFRFEASKNEQLPNDVVIEKRENDIYLNETIYLFVPVGTDFTNLTPTITFNAEELNYTQVKDLSNEYNLYPAIETSFDFSYPKEFILQLKNSSNNAYKLITVFVDVKKPVQLENTMYTTPNVKQSDRSTPFLGITKWKNIGNHKIEYQPSTTYENITPEVYKNPILANRVFVSGGLEPGAKADVNLFITSNLPVNEYKSTAVFLTRFVGHESIDDLIEPTKLNITSKVIE